MNKHLGSSFTEYVEDLLKDPEMAALMKDLEKQEEQDKLRQGKSCIVCQNATDDEHAKCTWCRTWVGRQKECQECGLKGRYKAKGLCVKCYFRARRAAARNGHK